MSLLSAKHWAFSPDGREFIITGRGVPEPWENRICTDLYTAIIRPDGSGPAWGREARNDRLLDDDSPRAVYIRDTETGEVWTPNALPGLRRPAGWSCSHGFGYTRLQGKVKGIAAEVTYVVPPEDRMEIWHIRLTNTTDDTRRLSVFSQLRWRLGYINTPPQNYDVTEHNGMIIARCLFWPGDAHRSSLPEFNREWDRIGFMAASDAPVAVDCLPEGFFGNGDAAHPQAVVEGRCTGSAGRGGETIGALQHDLTIPPGEAAELVIVVGAGENITDARRMIRKHASPAKATRTLKTLTSQWADYMDRLTVDLPDRDITRFANGWLRYALYIRYYLRYGYRDTAQDISMFFPIDVERGTRRLEELTQAQLTSGHCMHDIPHFGFPSHVSVNSDKAVWLIWVTGQYLRETGDWAWLKRRFTFHDGGSATGYEHLVRSVDYILDQSGRYGLPLMKCGDWNDALAGAYERGVSVWLAEFFLIALRDMVNIAEHTGRDKDAQRFAKEIRRLTRSINRYGWDGGWYVRGFDSDGRPIGSKKCKEGRIFANPQSWAVLAGVTDDDRARMILDAVAEKMDTPIGVPMMEPAYSKPNPSLGEITRFAPYHHHNGGVWNHLNTWIMLAECQIGRPDRALDLFRRTFPPRLAQELERFTAPPFAYPSWVNTPRSRLYGKADLGWNTGTTVWAHRVLTEGFCGVQATYEGLRITPSLPVDWTCASLVRPYRGATYDITIHKPADLTTGRVQLELDGHCIEGDVLPLPTHSTHRVTAIIEPSNAAT